MNPRLHLDDRTIYTYVFPTSDPAKIQILSSFWIKFDLLCEYYPIYNIEDCAKLPTSSVILFIITSVADLDVLLQLKQPRSIVKIVGYFLTEPEFQQIDRPTIRTPLKSRMFRLIYPDEFSAGLRFPSPEKAIDTIYARTIRNKFNVVNLATDITTFTQIDPTDAIAQIVEIGWYLRDKGLNHSDSAAGAIALRFGDGFLITASNTDKYHVSDRICYIGDYLPEDNTICYVGNGYLPSSESGVVDYAFDRFPAANVMLHFHYKPITFAANLDRYRTKQYTSYGTLAEAQIITAQFQQDKFAIASGHGEFILTSNFDEAKASIEGVLDLVRSGNLRS
jgi:ribulose-5-phosphate 4-epimerase/fuculose-1-phosphate aldolase